MISVAEALAQLFSLVRPMETEEVPLVAASGRTLARAVSARRSQPPFPSSAMDGYAMIAEEVAPGATFEVIGEAAGQVTDEFQQTHTEIPWQPIVGMRNRLIHAYFDVDLDRVWDTVNDDLPPLIRELEKIVCD